jgi:glycosyltransferase involved in cell wall biosynthesis
MKNQKATEKDDIQVAIVCDWLTGIGGAERVVLEMHRLFPEAPIYTSQYDRKQLDWFEDADVRTTWLQGLPKGLKKFLPVLRALAFSRLDLRDYDLILSSSGAEAKGVKRIKKDALHISYCHSPTHYYWSRYIDYMKNPGFGRFDPIARLGLKILAKPMRNWDYRAAQKPDVLIANSHHIQQRIKEYYGRDSTVIFPPVDIQRFTTQTKPAERHGFVVTGRQTPYKKIDLAVSACTELNLPLTVIGNGPDHEKIVKQAGPTITFLTNASDEDVAREVAKAEAFIFPGLDDFGIAPVEAMAAGTPVIAYKAGGALDYVIEGKTGTFFSEQSAESLIRVLQSFSPNQFDQKTISQAAKSFSAESFRHNLKSELERILKG